MADFLPAVMENTGLGPAWQRTPEWHILRFVSGHERVLLWFLAHYGVSHRNLTFVRKSRRAGTVTRSYFPGYIFCNFDVRLDRWQQITRMPYALDFLGLPTPIPDAMFDDLVRRCPERLGRTSAFAAVSLGSRIKVIRGPFQGHHGVVTWSDRKSVKIPILMFGSRQVDVPLAVSDIEIVG